MTNAPHDITTAFERIAAAGAAGTANFVGRGGTPGTATQERAIWALTGPQVTKCDVGAAIFREGRQLIGQRLFGLSDAIEVEQRLCPVVVQIHQTWTT